MSFDVVIVGGGPAGLSATLHLGRARKRVLLCDAGPRRNAAAEHVHGVVTRDGITPQDFRRAGREDLETYRNVETRDVGVDEIRGIRGSFEVRLQTGEVVTARRVLLATGVVDDLPEIDGFRALWGRSIVACPYCHAWEVQDRAFGFLPPKPEGLDFAILLRSWSSDVTLLTNAQHAIAPEMRERLVHANVRIDERAIARLESADDQLRAVRFTDGEALPLDILFARPPQRQVPVVRALDLALDANGYVQVDDKRQTSLPGIYAAGDLMSAPQSAILAAAAGAVAATMLNHDLTTDLAALGQLR